MEALPIKVLEHMCQYLAAEDLASCCAVSRKWREMFGGDTLWQVHCDQSMPERLDVNSCVVKPLFTSPGPVYSTLSAIGEWRMNYMREVHLKNNWSLGNFMKEEFRNVKEEDDGYGQIFYGNNTILIFKCSELEVWDVEKKPQLRKKFPFIFHDPYAFCVFVVHGSDKFVTVEGLFVRVYRLILTRTIEHLQLLHVFSLEMREKCSNSTEEGFEKLIESDENKKSTYSAVVKNILVGYSYETSELNVYIWNVETGHKLKEEMLPLFGVKYVEPGIPVCEKTMNIVLEGVEKVEEKCLGHWRVYSLTELAFLPFHKVHEILNDWSNDYTIIFDKYIAFLVDHTLYVYNYITSEIVYRTESDRVNLMSFGNYIVFEDDDTLRAVNPCAHGDRIEFRFDEPNDDRMVVGNKAIVCGRGEVDVAYVAVTKKAGKDGCARWSFPLCHKSHRCKPIANKACTKLAFIEYAENTRSLILNFW